MEAYLIAAPVWVRSVVLGVFFGVAMAVVPFGGGGDWAGRGVVGVVGVVGGIFFGFFMDRFIKRDLGASDAELRDLPIAQRRAAMRAAWRGPAPTDPAVRAAALHNAENTRDVTDRRWRLTTMVFVVFVVFLVVYTVMALTRSPWWWLAFAMFAGLLALHLTSRRRVERRIGVLSGPTPTTTE